MINFSRIKQKARDKDNWYFALDSDSKILKVVGGANVMAQSTSYFCDVDQTKIPIYMPEFEHAKRWVTRITVDQKSLVGFSDSLGRQTFFTIEGKLDGPYKYKQVVGILNSFGLRLKPSLSTVFKLPLNMIGLSGLVLYDVENCV